MDEVQRYHVEPVNEPTEENSSDGDVLNNSSNSDVQNNSVCSVDFEFIGGDARMERDENDEEEEFEDTDDFPGTEGQEDITKKKRSGKENLSDRKRF